MKRPLSLPWVVNSYKGLLRILVHILFWLVIYGYEAVRTNFMLKQVDFVFVLINLKKVLTIVILHYSFCYLIIPKIVIRKKWIGLGIYLLAAHLFMVFSLYYGFVAQRYYHLVPSYIEQFVAFYLKYDFLATAFDYIRIYNTLTFYSTLFFTIMLKMTKDFFRSNVHAFELEKEKLRLEKDNIQLELKFLKSQINPHFFFNTLNNLYSLIEEKDQHAADILLKLSDLMRYSLYESNQQMIPLERESKFVQDYLELERIRHRDNVSITLNIGRIPKNICIPPLILATFIENAFKHGIQSTIEPSWIQINIHVVESTLIFKIENSKPLRFASDVAQGGIGLLNVRRRLELLYPDAFKLQVHNQATIFSVELTVELYDCNVNVK
ncbi:histidine kinase [Cytophagaceae bacterium YF14B1]|uniref:Histidine kinase n=1 Tax=Xanthocytophaga flava TaxID=3048013 RepID=A0AAE3QYK3_9BACT|nr:histidine kinase [Xanthocytophaga flavus]MDJ1485606.1 histidine kinase [Xanthocytophaga flavus]